MNGRTVLLLVMFLIVRATVAQAQWLWGWGSWSGGSTVAGDAYRGQAEMLRAQGEYNRRTAEAALAQEQARSQYLQNQQQWNEMYYARQRAAHAAREQRYADQRASRERYKTLSESQPLPGLGLTDYDPVSGQLVWPAALQGDGFAKSRRDVEELLAFRAQATLTPEMAKQLTALAKTMQAELRQQIQSLPVHDYVAARKFLDNLAAEGRGAALAGT